MNSISIKPSENAIEQLPRILAFYRRLLDLTSDLLEAPLPAEDELEAIFDKRKNILSKIKKLEPSINQYTQEKDTQASDDLPAVSSQVNELLAAIHDAITELIDRDQKLKTVITAQKDTLSQELSRVAQGHKALKGYSRYRKGISYYVSTKS